MRALLPAAAGLLAAALLLAPAAGAPPKKAPARGPGPAAAPAPHAPAPLDPESDPTAEVRAANDWMEALVREAGERAAAGAPPAEREAARKAGEAAALDYTRDLFFLTFYAIPGPDRDAWVRGLQWWANFLSFNAREQLLLPVPGSGGRVFALRLSGYHWNRWAVLAVARRDPYMREPDVSTHEATRLRRFTGSRQEKADRPHCDGMVRADWFFRETVEADRSPAYYDLLYAKFRFKPRPPPEGPKPADVRRDPRYPQHVWVDGKWLSAEAWAADPRSRPAQISEPPPGDPGFLFEDFPKDEEDWEKAFGISDQKRLFKAQQIDPRRGAVVAGGRDDPKRGSIVARNNRFLEIVPITTRLGGVALETYDASESAGDQNYAEEHPNLVLGKIVSKAGELLATLPNGAQAALLINDKKRRAETADNRFAIDRTDPLDARVRTPGSCVMCHGPDAGFIEPRNLIPELLRAGVASKVKDPAHKDLIESFFLGWEEEVAVYRGPWKTLLARTSKGPDGKPWTEAEAVAWFGRARAWYDSPVDPRQAARETGFPEPLLKLVASRSDRIDLGGLAVGRPISRVTWERQSYGELMLLADAAKDPDAHPDPTKPGWRTAP